jgi:hypothetical protein
MLAVAEVAATVAVAAACMPDASTTALEGFMAAVVMRDVYIPRIR